MLDIDYQVIDTDSPTVTTGLLAFIKQGPSYNPYGYTLGDAVVMSTFLEGTGSHVAANQPTGVPLHVTWNMPADWAVDYGNIQVEALAKDSRNLLGIHWITVPASDGNSAVAVSSAPVSDGQLLDLWFWFLATHDGCSLTRGTAIFNSSIYGTGTVVGTTGAFTGQTLASHTVNSFNGAQTYSVTPAGRLFVYEKMGVRAIYGGELARAQAGNYGFSSLDAKTTIVKEAITATSYLKGWGTSTYGLTNWLAYSGSNPVQVATSGEHELILQADGALWSLGFNGYGQLGNGTTTDRSAPSLIATGVAQIAAGGNYEAIYGTRMGQSFFVKTDGTLWATGANGRGQLGDGTTTNRNTPVQIATNVSRVASGTAHTVFLKTNSTLWAVGANYYGQLGDGTNIDRATPVQIATGVAQVAAGDNHTLFVKTDGTLWVVGWNQYGQLGVGAGGSGQQNTPTQVATGVALAAGGSSHSMFVKTNGTLWAMGYNGYGELGDGTTTTRYVPVQIATGVSTAAVGSYHSLFVKTDGTLWAMGRNSESQLGDGTTNDHATPVQVDSGVTAIAAGYFNSLEIVVTAP